MAFYTLLLFVPFNFSQRYGYVLFFKSREVSDQKESKGIVSILRKTIGIAIIIIIGNTIKHNNNNGNIQYKSVLMIIIVIYLSKEIKYKTMKVQCPTKAHLPAVTTWWGTNSRWLLLYMNRARHRQKANSWNWNMLSLTQNGPLPVFLVNSSLQCRRILGGRKPFFYVNTVVTAIFESTKMVTLMAGAWAKEGNREGGGEEKIWRILSSDLSPPPTPLPLTVTRPIFSPLFEFNIRFARTKHSRARRKPLHCRLGEQLIL